MQHQQLWSQQWNSSALGSLLWKDGNCQATYWKESKCVDDNCHICLQTHKNKQYIHKQYILCFWEAKEVHSIYFWEITVNSKHHNYPPWAPCTATTLTMSFKIKDETWTWRTVWDMYCILGNFQGKSFHEFLEKWFPLIKIFTNNYGFCILNDMPTS